jgi:hypothetical protein
MVAAQAHDDAGDRPMTIGKSENRTEPGSGAATHERARAATGGLIGGLVGGLVLTIFMVVMNLATEKDVWVGAKFAALPFLGLERVMQSGFEAGPVLLGTISHFAVSAAWGVPFGLLFYDFSKSATVVAGAFWGIVVWLGMYYLVLPIIGAGHVLRMTPAPMAIMEHVLFGISVALGFLPFQRVRGHAPVRRPTPVSH